MLAQYSFVLGVVPLSRLLQLIDFVIDAASIIVADDLTKFIHFLNGLYGSQ